VAAHCRLEKIAATAVKDLSVFHGARFLVVNPHDEIETHCDEAGGRAEISVHNEGSPIAFIDLASIFKPYRRTGSAEAAGQKGWGIGLALVKGITEAHGGKVKVQSDQGGTTFRESLPLEKT
jgi:signal transduction histidine kinase